MRKLLFVGIVGVVITACSSSSTSTDTSAATSAPAASTTAVAPTVLATTVPATTTPPTTVPVPTVLTLRSDGLGPLDLGVPADEVINAVTAQFGSPVSDEVREYPADDGAGGFQDVTGEFGFFAQHGRTVCWSNQFCAEFGNSDPTLLFFAGWTYAGLALATTSGLTVGTRWSDALATITVYPGGCYSVGNGESEGILLTLTSQGDPFSSFDDVGNYVEGAPAPESVTVAFMQAGQVPAFLFGDC